MADNTARNAAIGFIVVAVGGFLFWQFGFNNSSPSPSIEGPSTVYVTTPPVGLPDLGGSGSFSLRGFADGGYREMYWVDTFGTTIPFAGDGFNQPFRCPRAGTFTVTLNEVNREGHRGKASQTINCIAQ